MITLLSTAFALPCAPGDIACDAANDAAALINAMQPGRITDDAADARFRTGTLAARFATVQGELDAAGCSIDGVTAGAYGRGAWNAGWSDFGGAGGGATGGYGLPLFSGSFAGDASGTIGESLGLVGSDGRLVGDRSGAQGFVAGRFVRVNGRRGVVYAMHGTCPVPAAGALSSWFGPELGCTDPADPAYDPAALVDDGSCVNVPVPGCTDPEAPNYDPEATVDDGSCLAPNDCSLALDPDNCFFLSFEQTPPLFCFWNIDDGLCLLGM